MHELVQKRVNVRLLLYSLARLEAQTAVKQGYQALNIINRIFVSRGPSREKEGQEVEQDKDDVVLTYSYTSVPYGDRWIDIIPELQRKFNVTIRETFYGIDPLQNIDNLSIYPRIHDDFVVTDDVLLTCFCDEGSPLPLSRSETDLQALEGLTLEDEK